MKERQWDCVELESRQYRLDSIDRDPRFEHAYREMLWTFCTYALYVLVAFVLVYSLSRGNPQDYDYLFGLPSYLTWLCILGFAAMLVVCTITHFVFKDESLEPELPEEH